MVNVGKYIPYMDPMGTFESSWQCMSTSPTLKLTVGGNPNAGVGSKTYHIYRVE